MLVGPRRVFCTEYPLGGIVQVKAMLLQPTKSATELAKKSPVTLRLPVLSRPLFGIKLQWSTKICSSSSCSDIWHCGKEWYLPLLSCVAQFSFVQYYMLGKKWLQRKKWAKNTIKMNSCVLHWLFSKNKKRISHSVFAKCMWDKPSLLRCSWAIFILLFPTPMSYRCFCSQLVPVFLG